TTVLGARLQQRETRDRTGVLPRIPLVRSMTHMYTRSTSQVFCMLPRNKGMTESKKDFDLSAVTLQFTIIFLCTYYPPPGMQLMKRALNDAAHRAQVVVWCQ